MLRQLLRCLAVLPVILPFAHGQVAKQNPYEADIAKFEAEDLKNPPAKGGIVFVGSSSIRLWTSLKEDFPAFSTLNRGFGGSEISDSVYFAKRIITPYKPKVVVFFAGTNDIANGKSAETVLADYKRFVGEVRSELPLTDIVYIGISPAPSRWAKIDVVKNANGLIQKFCKDGKHLLFLDTFRLMTDGKGGPRPELFLDDQLHLKPAGYAIWTKALGPVLKRLMKILVTRSWCGWSSGISGNPSPPCPLSLFPRWGLAVDWGCCATGKKARGF